MTNRQGLTDIQQQLRRGETTCVALVESYLARLHRSEALNAFTSVLAERALARAEQVDTRLASGHAGALAGAMVAVKDLVALADAPLTCASRMLEHFVPPYSATAVERLEAADAIIIGKTNMDEFAMGSSSENSAFGAVRNPHDHERVAGGSSGGSAAAVAAELATAALGSDTGGSIRQPAAFCGVVGLKPTYGRVSRWGLVAFASSLDQIGPITVTVEDAARVLEVIAGHDERDSTSASVHVPAFSQLLDGGVRGKTVGLPREYLSGGLQREIHAAIENAKKLLERNGAIIKEVSLPHTEFAIATYYIICTAEASSNLSRYDGARYGRRAGNVETLEEMYVKSRSEGFGPEVKRRIMLGTYVLSAGYYDAFYRRAMKVRTLIRRDFDAAFSQCDALLTPTTPSTAFKLGEKLDDPLQMYLSDIFTVSVNLAGLPGISIPAGKDDSGLPIGVQLIGKPFDEVTLLQIARLLEAEGLNE